MVTLHWTPQPVDDLKSIFQYISFDSRFTANLFVEKIYHHVNRLVYRVVNNDYNRILTVIH